ncbi:MAG TPA: hypothetical protein VKH35_09855 [Thermoanaerobaculia bacterium]|nr:hypothetical protein [Thermoanaerobaculia bacterium]
MSVRHNRSMMAIEPLCPIAPNRPRTPRLRSIRTITDAFSKAVASSYCGTLPTQLNSEHAGEGPVQQTRAYDTNGVVTVSETGSLTWEQHFDQAGNVASAQLPARPESTS